MFFNQTLISSNKGSKVQYRRFCSYGGSSSAAQRSYNHIIQQEDSSCTVFNIQAGALSNTSKVRAVEGDDDLTADCDVLDEHHRSFVGSNSSQEEWDDADSKSGIVEPLDCSEDFQPSLVKEKVFFK